MESARFMGSGCNELQQHALPLNRAVPLTSPRHTLKSR
ncbi:hypothetical protein Poly24_36520 [Rosistilla carotiformis]|uniref:Uncharacterized protein n=1 Tax=Rosistilla carotiformis TaxID=2528017 RepID=A0A518JWL9_9BACT|nr:hypothetical protein Poly24_36520 [Rosistilla carotiformis]